MLGKDEGVIRGIHGDPGVHGGNFLRKECSQA